MIRDRGLQKWHGFFMPEHVAELNKIPDEMNKCEKPLIDEYQRVEFDERIAYAMEFNMPVRLTVWIGGHLKDTIGRVHYCDVVKQQLRIETLMHDFVRVNLSDVVGVEIID